MEWKQSVVEFDPKLFDYDDELTNLDKRVTALEKELKDALNRATTAEAVLADLLKETEGIEGPQLSVGREVWWWGLHPYIVPNMKREFAYKGVIVSIGKREVCVLVDYDTPVAGNKTLAFIAVEGLLFTQPKNRTRESPA